MTDIRFELQEINTWRLFNKAVTQQGVVEMVESWEANGYRFGCVCIDDGWTIDGRLGDWTPDPTRFPDLAGLVDWIHAKGYAVRLWVAPTQCHPETDIYKKAFPDSLLKTKTGEPAHYVGLNTYRIDPRTPVGKEHIRSTMQRLVRDYKIDAFKVDFPPFYEPRDEFYEQVGYDFSAEDDKNMVPDFYKQVNEAVTSVNPAGRICCAKHIENCQPYIQDTICGDFVGQDRSVIVPQTSKHLKDYIEGHNITPWLEMIWGEESEAPRPGAAWHAGYLEFLAQSMNYGFKLEHSFFPFNYPNANQIRILSNLYGARNTKYKVIAAGRKTYPVPLLLEAGIEMDANTRFLVAPEEESLALLHTGLLGTSCMQWKCRNVLTGEMIRLRGRNELWGGTMDWCRVEFEAKAYQTYELWHEGEPVTFYRDHFEKNYGKYAVEEEADKPAS
ncbi:MAG: alpha-galactosidase [Chthoniobacterales bacterium]